jgi:hypothetical protein
VGDDGDVDDFLLFLHRNSLLSILLLPLQRLRLRPLPAN